MVGKIILAIDLIILSIFDCKERKVPLILLYVGVAIAILFTVHNCLKNSTEWDRALLTAVLGMIPGVFMLLMACVTQKAGCGDGLALVGVGVLVGYRNCWGILCISLLLMTVCCIVMLLARKGSKDSKIPYLPFLTIAYLTVCSFEKGGAL